MVLLALVFLLFHKDTLPYLAHKYHQDLGIEYAKIEGTLFYGMRVEGLKYDTFLELDVLELRYNLLMLFAPTPRLQKVYTQGLFFDKAKFDSLGDDTKQESSFSLFVEELSMQDSQLLVEGEPFFVDLSASALHYDKTLDLESVSARLRSSYGDLGMRGSILDSELRATVKLTPSEITKEQYLGALASYPQSVMLDLFLTQDLVFLQTDLKDISLKAQEDLLIENLALEAKYMFENQDLFVETNSSLRYEQIHAQVLQSGTLGREGRYETNLNATFRSGELLVEDITAKLIGDTKGLDLSLGYKEHQIQVKTQSFEDFHYQLLSPYLFAKGSGNYKNEKLTLESEIDLNTTIPHIQKLKLQGYYTQEKSSLQLTMPLASIDLSYKENELTGVAKVAQNEFDIYTKSKMQELFIDADIESLKSFLVALELDLGENIDAVDAKIQTKTKLRWVDSLCVESKIEVPWYKIALEDQIPLYGEDLSLVLSYCQDELLVQSYEIQIQEHTFFATKPSKVLIDTNGDLLLEELYINDTMRVQGFVSLERERAELEMKSDRFIYETQDMNLSLAVDLGAEIEFGGKQKISGAVTLLEGLVSFMPREDYKIRDKDIIIIQDIKEKQDLQREIDITIDAKKAISYQVENVDLEFIPDLRLLQSPGKDLSLLGSVSIKRGEITLSDRVFVFDPSSLTFDAREPIDPQLNLNLHHYTLDGIDIKIYVTHTMSDPVILFSSQPAMSQEDILSYILFGESASSVFDTSGGGSSKASVSALLLGTGFKQLLNQSNLLKVDTLNILTNEEGTLGYEIGTRINKNIRLVYKNESVSSMILQYTLSRSVRIDVDVDETGQGVSILYVKEFAFPLGVD